MVGVPVLNNQSLFDVAIQECGSTEAAFRLAFDNAMSVTDDLSPGQTVSVSHVENSKIVDFYRTNGIKPATAVDAEQPLPPPEYKIFDFTFDSTFE